MKSDAISPHQPFFLTRRSLLKVGMSAFGLMAMSSVGVAALCPSVSTPRQTRGPYFPYDDAVAFPIREDAKHALPLIEANDNDLTRVKGKSGAAQGQVVYFQGQLLRQSSQENAQSDICVPLAGATVLLWQANFSGRYNHRLDEAIHAKFPHPRPGT